MAIRMFDFGLVSAMGYGRNYVQLGYALDFKGFEDSWATYDAFDLGCRRREIYARAMFSKLDRDGYYKLQFDKATKHRIGHAGVATNAGQPRDPETGQYTR